MSLPAIDAFTGANGDPLNATNWAIDTGTWQIFGNKATPNTGGIFNTARWKADTVSADHYAQAKITSSAGGHGGGVIVRIRQADPTNYYVLFVQSDVVSVHLSRIDSGSEVVLQNITGLTIVDGDLFKLQVSGTTLKAYQNGVQIGSDQADGAFATGQPGIFGVSANGELLDDFQADNLAATSRYILVRR